ncbi:MAG: DUF3131 domain-containing protein [Clostridia bacterium]|nr:DUF3131 domain-containing protein [Clostridia bacterium]
MSVLSEDRRRVFRRLFLGRHLSRILRGDDPDRLDPQEIARRFAAPSLRSIRRLWQKLERYADRLLQKGSLSPERHRAWILWLGKASPDELAELLSPCHAPLEKLEFYHLSDAATRRALRRGLARFARRHRLSPESAVLLWRGETRTASPKSAALLLLPLPLLVGAILFAFFILPLPVAWLFLLAIPALFAGGYTAVAALLRRLLPNAALPLLEDGTGHAVLTVCVGTVAEADRAFDTVARIIAAEADGDCLLVLALSDASVAEEARDAGQIAALRRRADELSRTTDVSVALLVPPRRYAPGRFGRTRYRGMPDLPLLAGLIARYTDSLPSRPEAVCFLPADGISLPGSGERMAAALFHPLCKQDVLVYRSPADPALPHDRLAVLRQCLLQKFDAPADLVGWGIYRTDALRTLAAGDIPSARLAPQPLYAPSGKAPSLCTALVRKTPTLLPALRWALPILRALLIFGMVAADLPVRFILLLWLTASADLLTSALLSLRTGCRFFLYTLPAWKKCAIALLHRTFLPMATPWRLAGGESLSGLCALSLLFGGAVIATGAPLSVLGLCFCIAPLLTGEFPVRTELSADQKGACHRLAGELASLLPTDGDRLPPAYLTEDGQQCPYTTPSALGLCLAAEVAACDLGLIDPYTLERRVSGLLHCIEALPTRCGLPYARYRCDTGEFYQNSRVDTAEAGLYALCLAAAKAGLREHAVRQPGLLLQAERLARLSERMDLTLLQNDDGSLCRALTPEGEREGRLSYLFGSGGPALFAFLASDSTRGMSGKQKTSAWNALLAPARCRKGHCLLLSEKGALADYLLPAFLLPASKGSMIREGTRLATRAALREGRRRVKRVSLPDDPPREQRIRVKSLLCWPRLGRSPRPIANGCASLSHTAPQTSQAITAPLLCLLLSDDPRLALSHLSRLQQTDPAGGFAHPDRPGQIATGEIALSLIALAGAVTGRQFSDRLASIPRFGALLPLLSHRPDEWNTEIPARPEAIVCPVLPARSAPSPSVCLLGDASGGLLIAEGRGISLRYQGCALTAPTPVGGLLASGRFSGLLLMREDGILLPLPRTVRRREAGALTLADDGGVCRVCAAAGGWSLIWERTDTAPVDLRFLFCPAVPRARLSEEILSDSDGNEMICLCIEYSPTLTVVIGVTGLAAPFTHADPSPFPRGSGQVASIFRIAPKQAAGIVETPSCMIGGRLCQAALQVRLTVAADRAAVLSLLREHSPTDAVKPSPLPLPVPDGSLASRVLEWQIGRLFEGSPIPAAMAIGSDGSDRDQLARCLAGGAKLLAEKGFPLSDEAPLPLSVSRREGAEALIARLLSAAPADAETPLLPAEGRITYPDGFPHILRGRDEPTPARSYRNGIATLTASPDGLRYRPHRGAPELSLSLFLTHKERTLLMPAAAMSVTYSPSEVIFEGEDFTLRAMLLPRLPLLAIGLRSEGDAVLTCSALPSPYKEEENESLYALPDGRMLFVRRLMGEREKVLLIGSFPRERNHLYYRIRETITLRSLPGITQGYDRRLRTAASLLRIEGEEAPSLPAVAAAVLASDSPAKALLSPLCAPEEAVAALIRLAGSPPTLLFPMALALQVDVTDRTTAAELRIPVEGGRASLYLLAARCLEQAMEEDAAHPLLPPVVAAFARLAERLGDHTGKELYAAFAPPDDPPPTRWDALPDVSPETIDLLADLQRGASGAVDALLNALSDLPVSPTPADAALLWSGLLWGVLGFTPSPFGDGFTLAPLAAEREMTVLLAYKGEWRIRMAPGEAPICTRADDPGDSSPAKEQKIFQNRKFSPQSSCIIHKNSVK